MQNINVIFYGDMGHLVYNPTNIPSELINKILNEYIEVFYIRNKFSTRHYKLKKNIKTVNIVINNINYNCYLNV